MKKYTLILMILFFTSGCALQSDVLLLENRIMKLERQKRNLQELQAKTSETQIASQKDLRTGFADLKLSVTQMREEMNAMNGRFEEINYTLSQKQNVERGVSEKINKMQESFASMTERIVRLEQYMGFEPSEKFSSAPKGASANKDTLSERQLYDMAKETFDKGNMDMAREGFQTFLKKYPKSQNADNAQFWIGDIYYRQKWYEKAILEYQKVIDNYPKGNKVPAAYLKQGFAFQNLGEKANARLILKELIAKYPKSKEAEIANDKIKVFN